MIVNNTSIKNIPHRKRKKYIEEHTTMCIGSECLPKTNNSEN